MKRLLTILTIASLGGWLSSCTTYYDSTAAYDADDVYGNSAAKPDGYTASNEKRTETDEEFDKYLSEGEYTPEEDGDYYDPNYSDSLKSSGNGGDTYYINEYNDYSYANRIRRFNNPYYGYYDPFYSGWGVSVGYTPFWNGPNRWNYYAGWYSPWSWYGAGSPYWGYGGYYNRPPWWYNGYGMYGNYWNGYNNGYYNGYYAGAYGYPYGYNNNGWGGGGYYYGNNAGDLAGNNSGSSYFGPRGNVSSSTSTGGSSYDNDNTIATYSGLAKPAPEVKISKPQSVPVYSGLQAEGTTLVSNDPSLKPAGNLKPTTTVRAPNLVNKKPESTVARSPWGKKPDRYTQPAIEHNRSPYNENNWNRTPARNNSNNYYNRTPSNNYNNNRTPSNNNYNNRTPSRNNNNYNRTPSNNNNSINRSPSRNNNSISTPSRGRTSTGTSRSSSSSSKSRSSSSSSKRKR